MNYIHPIFNPDASDTCGTYRERHLQSIAHLIKGSVVLSKKATVKKVLDPCKVTLHYADKPDRTLDLPYAIDPWDTQYGDWISMERSLGDTEVLINEYFEYLPDLPSHGGLPLPTEENKESQEEVLYEIQKDLMNNIARYAEELSRCNSFTSSGGKFQDPDRVESTLLNILTEVSASLWIMGNRTE